MSILRRILTPYCQAQSFFNSLLEEKPDSKPLSIEPNNLAVAFHLALIFCKGSRHHDILSNIKLRFALDVGSSRAAVYNPSFEKPALGREMRVFSALCSLMPSHLFVLGTTKASFILGFSLPHCHISWRLEWFLGHASHSDGNMWERFNYRRFREMPCFQIRWMLEEKNVQLQIRTSTGSKFGRLCHQSARNQLHLRNSILQIDLVIKPLNDLDQKNRRSPIDATGSHCQPCGRRGRLQIRTGNGARSYFQRRRTMASAHCPWRLPRSNLRMNT